MTIPKQLTGLITFACLSITMPVRAQQMVATAPMLGTGITQSVTPRAADNWKLSDLMQLETDRLGQVWVLDYVDKSLRLFSERGKLIRVVAKMDEPDGAFTRSSSMQMLGDTLWISDNDRTLATPFSLTGFPLPNTRKQFGIGHTSRGLSPGGRFFRFEPFPTDAPAKRMARTIVHVPNGAVVPQTVLTIADRAHPPVSARMYNPAYAATPFTNAGYSSRQQPFDDRDLYVLGAGGQSYVVVERSATRITTVNPRTWFIPQAEVRIVEVGLKGDTLFDRRYLVPAVPLSAARVNAALDTITRELEASHQGNQRVYAPDLRDSLFVPKIWPPITDILIGTDGSFWLRQPSAPAQTARYWRIAHDGTILLPASVDANLEIARVSTNRILGYISNGAAESVIQWLEVVPVPTTAQPRTPPI
ncbi:MAG: hypothetical protein ABI120_26030 [Gemmatimonadaceae bacterium]